MNGCKRIKKRYWLYTFFQGRKQNIDLNQDLFIFP